MFDSIITFINEKKFLVMLNLVLGLLTHVNVNCFQLLMISRNHFGCNPPFGVKGIFLYFSKDFGRVYHMC